jgi:hypothetical protein
VLIIGPSRVRAFDALHSALTNYLMVMYPLPEIIRAELDERLSDAAGLAWRAWNHRASYRVSLTTTHTLAMSPSGKRITDNGSEGRVSSPPPTGIECHAPEIRNCTPTSWWAI